jgi:hypothetical protein
MFDKYRDLENDQDRDSKSSSSSSLSSVESDFEKVGQPRKSSQESNASFCSKLRPGSCLLLAINSSKKYFTRFLFKPRSGQSYLNVNQTDSRTSVVEECLNLDDSDQTQLYQQEFVTEVSNWIDKYTEGLCEQNKKFVSEWPEFTV